MASFTFSFIVYYYYYYYYYIRLTAFFQDNLGNWHQKGKPFWILLEQEMMGWQWHQLDHMQIICTFLQTDNHASTSPLSFLQAGCPSCHPAKSVKAVKAFIMAALWNRAGHYIFMLWFLSVFFYLLFFLA